jgi:SAM-dependent methyltransferase
MNDKILDYLPIQQKELFTDIGSGTGNFSLYLRKRSNCKVICVDISGEMIRRLQYKMKMANVEDIEICTGDLLNLPFRDNCVDISFSKFVLHDVKDKNKAIAEMIRILRRGGNLCVVDLLKGDLNNLYNILAKELGIAPELFIKNDKRLSLHGLSSLIQRNGADIQVKLELRFPITFEDVYIIDKIIFKFCRLVRDIRRIKMISVVVVAYHYKYFNRMLAVFKSILENTDDNIELIISTHTIENIEKLNKYLNEKVTIVVIKSNNFKNSRSFYRNIAVKYAKGEYLYFTDEDVIIYDQRYLNFLEKISKETDESVIVWPKMFRLKKNIDKFCNDFINGDKKMKFFFNPHHCIYGYSNGEFYEVPELKMDFDGVPCVCTLENYNILKNANLNEFEEIVWRPSVHWGGIFSKKIYFEDVGGFSLEYINWGCEDDDLIWKLSQIHNIVYSFKKFPNLSVLHLEHPRKYWSSYNHNMQIFEKRKKKDPNHLILEDKKRYDNIPNDIVYLIRGGNK